MVLRVFTEPSLSSSNPLTRVVKVQWSKAWFLRFDTSKFYFKSGKAVLEGLP
ncbi:hypothetical protein CKA32_000845 [Geitlerinema sp. FC II]|nr:hypothetical protein CKA32_000845 [Geitlerinema sp. FC II]